MWTDSKVAISWVSSTKDIRDVYVANRVAEIQSLSFSLGIQIHHVPTETNPADLLSCARATNKLKSSIWQHGPEWLSTQNYPEQTSIHVATNELLIEINAVNPVPPVLDLERISSYPRAVNIMSRILSFIKSSADPLMKLGIQEQRLHCNSIYSHLINPMINVTIDVKSSIRDIDLHLIDGVIKAKGRLINSELSLEAQTPLFLPNRSRLVDLVVQHTHQTHNNCSLSQTLSVFHQFFWTPKIRARLKSLILRCVTCRRQRVRTIAKPLPPPLPA